MKLNSGEFETEIDEDGDFVISICHESDWSTDGGYSFEDVTNTFALDRENAIHLVDELQAHLDLY